MGSLFSGLFGGGPRVSRPPRPPERSDAEIQQAASEERRRRAAAVGRRATILTSPRGVTGTTGTIKRKTLLGE